MPFHHTAIIGLGLLGGSLALDLRKRFPAMTITGIARREETLQEASALRMDGAPVFTHLARELSAVRGADLVVLCTPVQTIVAQTLEMAPFLTPGVVVTDVGSTKRVIMNTATALPAGISFVGGHPMAGSDRKGLSHARLGLYQGATWAVCVPPGAEAAAERLVELIQTLGAFPLPIDAGFHDELVALSSHLPHVVAAALTNVVLGSAHEEALQPFIAAGFKDTTRIAASSPAMWRDICLANRDYILTALDGLLQELGTWREALRARDAAHLEALFTTARARRERLN
jgi:prephenate dehydrogenase